MELSGSPAGDQQAVALRGIGHKFVANRRPLAAVDRIDLTVEDGVCVALVGPSGCGKSTVLRIVAGLITATEGDAQVFGRSPQAARRAKLLGAVFQDSALFPWRTVEENARLPADLARLPKPEAERRARRAVEQMGVADSTALRPHQLSGGMKQRVAVARSLVLEPRLLLMDEPFASLDYLTRETLQEQVAATLRGQGMASLLVTHDVNEAVFMADHIVALTDRPARIAGQVAVEGPATRTPPFRASTRFHEAVESIRKILGGTGEQHHTG